MTLAATLVASSFAQAQTVELRGKVEDSPDFDSALREEAGDGAAELAFEVRGCAAKPRDEATHERDARSQWQPRASGAPAAR